jgi:hypothetical protein
MDPGDVISKSIKDNETWNSCPECKKDWKDIVATPGIIHRIRLCARCIMKAEHGGPKRNRLH